MKIDSLIKLLFRKQKYIKKELEVIYQAPLTLIHPIIYLRKNKERFY